MAFRPFYWAKPAMMCLAKRMGFFLWCESPLVTVGHYSTKGLNISFCCKKYLSAPSIKAQRPGRRGGTAHSCHASTLQEKCLIENRAGDASPVHLLLKSLDYPCRTVLNSSSPAPRASKAC